MQRNYSQTSHSIIDRTYSRMVSEIESGQYAPGQRLAGDRELCRQYGIGRSSMIQVLAMLQAERYVERIPVYGTFVRQDVAQRHPVLSLVFATPDASMSPAGLGVSSWSGVMEILRGMFEESSLRPGVRITQLYCPDTDDPTQAARQLEDLKEYSGVVFCGFQMGELKRQYATLGKPAIVVAPKREYPELFPTVGFERLEGIRKMAQVIATHHPGKTVALAHWPGEPVDKLDCEEEFRLVVAELTLRGMALDNLFLEQSPGRGEDVAAFLQRHWGSLDCFRGKVVWCLNRRMVPVLNYLLLLHGVASPLYGLQSSAALAGLYPPVPFMLEPYCEAGRLAIAMLCSYCQTGVRPANRMLPSAFHCGVSPRELPSDFSVHQSIKEVMP